MIRKCLVCLGLLAEPCLHVIAVRYGIHIQHPEGLSSYFANYVISRGD